MQLRILYENVGGEERRGAEELQPESARDAIRKHADTGAATVETVHDAHSWTASRKQRWKQGLLRHTQYGEAAKSFCSCLFSALSWFQGMMGFMCCE